MKQKQITLIHIVFWLIALSLNFAFLIFRDRVSPLESYIYLSVKSLLEVTSFYIFYLLVIPFFYQRKKNYRLLFVVSIIYLIIYSLFYAVVLTLADIFLGLRSNWSGFKFGLLVAIYYSSLYAILGTSVRLTFEGIKTKQIKLQLEKQQVKTELALLRSQINPHFLFNSLNTIHSYVSSNHPHASSSVVKLSDIMRYMLYDASKDFITIEKEIAFLESYIELQNFRLENPELVNFYIDVQNKNLLIAPMIFIPFVENAYKHGRKKNGDMININLFSDDSVILFSMKNHIDNNKTTIPEEHSGIGLINVKRRLELLYPQKNQLKTEKKDHIFEVELKIELK